MSRSNYISDVKRLYTKVSGGLLITGGKTDYNQFRDLSEDLASLYTDGTDIIHVSSGAINCGRDVHGIPMEKDLHKDEMRAIATTGQSRLMAIYTEYMNPVKCGQVLISSDDLSDLKHQREIIYLYNSLRNMGVVPIINNNDSVNSEEVKYSENDELCADLVVTLEGSTPSGNPLCVMLSENALREDANPEAPEIPYVGKINDDIMGLAWEHNGNQTFGGMEPKLNAIKRITEAGYPVVLVDGKYSRTGPKILRRITEGEEIGTFFEPQTTDF